MSGIRRVHVSGMLIVGLGGTAVATQLNEHHFTVSWVWTCSWETGMTVNGAHCHRPRVTMPAKDLPMRLQNLHDLSTQQPELLMWLFQHSMSGSRRSWWNTEHINHTRISTACRHFIDENLNGQRCRAEILRPIVIWPSNNNNNAHRHIAKISKNVLERKGLPVLKRPPYSPEMSPIEHFRVVLDRPCSLGMGRLPDTYWCTDMAARCECIGTAAVIKCDFGIKFGCIGFIRLRIDIIRSGSACSSCQLLFRQLPLPLLMWHWHWICRHAGWLNPIISGSIKMFEVRLHR